MARNPQASQGFVRIRGALSHLGGIFGVTEPLSVGELAIGPAQPVADTTRIAELKGLGLEDGWVSGSINNVHAIAGTISDSFDPYVIVEALGGTRGGSRIWAMYAYVETDTPANAGLTKVFVAYPLIPFVFPAGGPNANAPQIILASAPSYNANGDAASPDGALWRPGVPVFVPPGSEIFVTSTTTGAAEVSGRVVFWCGARGARPPGLA